MRLDTTHLSGRVARYRRLLAEATDPWAAENLRKLIEETEKLIAEHGASPGAMESAMRRFR